MVKRGHALTRKFRKIKQFGAFGNCILQFNALQSYSERLTSLNLYSVQRRERYIIIYVWKMLESKVLNFNPPIISLWNERRGRMCRVSCSFWP